MFLILNCGSSTVKLAVFSDSFAQVQKVLIENPGPRAIAEALQKMDTQSILGIGHRVVHGGTQFEGPALITADVRGQIARLSPLAPAHQPHNIAGIDIMQQRFPNVPQVACFDTSFHRTIPPHRQLMPLPRHFASKGLLRYGFHGLSYLHIAREVQVPRLVACHLGNGCSIAAIENGRSVYTSMGFTPLDGLMMGSRSGSLDPGAVLWLVDRLGSTAAVNDLLNKDSGLKGVSGISSDMRELLASDDPNAKLAVTMFVDRVVLEVGRAAAALQGIDAIAFTGGIGENAADIRKAAMAQLNWLGTFAVHVIPAAEERVIAEAVAVMLSHPPQRP